MEKSNSKNKTEYFAKYYEENRPAILAKRRIRYKNDPEYREKMREKARERARRKAEESKRERVEKSRSKAEDLRRKSLNLATFSPQQIKRWPVGDFVTSSVVSEALNVSVGTLGNWIRTGVLPPPTISSTAGKHMFSIEYLNMVRNCRIEALSSGLENKFEDLVKSKYADIKDSEDLMRRGGLVE